MRHILAAFRYSTVPLTSGALGAAPALRRRERSNQRSLLTPRLSASLALKGARTGGSAKKSNQRAALDRSSGSPGRSAGAALSFCIFEVNLICSNKRTALPATSPYNAHRRAGGRGRGTTRESRKTAHRALQSHPERVGSKTKSPLPFRWWAFSYFSRSWFFPWCCSAAVELLRRSASACAAAMRSFMLILFCGSDRG